MLQVSALYDTESRVNSKKKYELILEYSLYGYCLSAGLSIAASQIFVCLNIITYLFIYLKTDKNLSNPTLNIVKRSGLIFILAGIICSLMGIDIQHSGPEMLKTCFYFIFPFSVLKSIENNFSRKRDNALWLLLLSQSIAALHTLITLSFPDFNIPKTPGAVTESGQLVLVIPVAFALFYSSTNFYNILIAAVTFSTFLAASYIQPYLCIIVFLLFGYKAYLAKKEKDLSLVLPIIFAMLFAALAVNLKRGPWMGVFFEFLLLGIFVSRKFIYYSLISSTLLLTISPIRQRIIDLSDHFLIQGGRYAMWKLGIDIFARFPLGVGLNNSTYMRVFDPSLPQTHRHMHNNLLNIAVETGIIGLAAYIILFFSIYKLGTYTFQKATEQTKLLTLCIIIAIFGWQVAGLVEYNFGDSEIRLIALFLIGVLFSLSVSETSETID